MKNYKIWILLALIMVCFVVIFNDREPAKPIEPPHQKEIEDKNIEYKKLEELVQTLIESERKSISVIYGLKSELNNVRQMVEVNKAEAAKDYPAFYRSRFGFDVGISPESASSLIANDLIEGDAAKEQVVILQAVVDESENLLNKKDSIVYYKDQQIVTLNDLINIHSEQTEWAIKGWEKERSKNKKKDKYIGGAFGLGLITGLIANGGL